MSRVEAAREIELDDLHRVDGFDTLLRVLEMAEDMASRRLQVIPDLHGGATKADTEAAALAHQCRKVWESATGQEAPKTIRAAGDIPGGDPARKASPFELFCRDVFVAHGRTEASVPGAFDTLRAVLRQPLCLS